MLKSFWIFSTTFLNGLECYQLVLNGAVSLNIESKLGHWMLKMRSACNEVRDFTFWWRWIKDTQLKWRNFQSAQYCSHAKIFWSSASKALYRSASAFFVVVYARTKTWPSALVNVESFSKAANASSKLRGNGQVILWICLSWTVILLTSTRQSGCESSMGVWIPSRPAVKTALKAR